MVPEFVNEALTDFSDSAQREAMQAALRDVKAEFDREWPLVIGGERISSGAWTESLNPCNKTQVVGRAEYDLKKVGSLVVGCSPVRVATVGRAERGQEISRNLYP